MTSNQPLSRAEAFACAPELKAIATELATYERLLTQWQRSINLVAASTLPEIWPRHFADSAQLLALVPDAKVWVDLGSGGGFPGLVTALLLKHIDGATVHLIESDQRKAAFLRAVSRETLAPVTIHADRIEMALSGIGRVDAVSARALAPLSRLLELAGPALEQGAVGVFLKGEDWAKELTAIPAPDRFTIETLESRTDKRARVVVVKRTT